MLADGLEDVDGAEDVDLEVAPRALHGGGHRDLAGKVEDDVWFQVLDHTFHVEGVTDISVDKVDRILRVVERAQPSQVG